MLEPVATFCRRHALPWDDRRRTRLEEYLDLLEQFNASMNLVGPMGRSEMVESLIVDSLAPAAFRTPDATLLDVGTGAGLPGLPLAIVAEPTLVTLVEPRRKRSTFLRITSNRLGLEGVEIERSRIEHLDPEPHDYVISKAFRPPREWLEIAVDWVASDGCVVCMTTADETPVVEEGAAAEDLEIVDGTDDVSTVGASNAGERTRAVHLLARRD